MVNLGVNKYMSRVIVIRYGKIKIKDLGKEEKETFAIEDEVNHGGELREKHKSKRRMVLSVICTVFKFCLQQTNNS